MSKPRLTVLLGAGGVGKTTLAAGYALALARAGRRVGLLGIDPSRRLQGALGIPLADVEQPVPSAPGCRAAVLAPAESLRRWAAEACDEETRARLFANPFFVALADRLATATDVVAAIRVAEWAERDPSLTDLVVDTAPGLNALEFLRRPRHLSAFLEADLVSWFRKAALPTRSGGLLPRARVVAAGLARLVGGSLFLDFADFLAAVEAPTERMLGRVAQARSFVEDHARIVLVTAVRDDTAGTAAAIARALREAGLEPTATVVNRAVPSALEGELAGIDVEALAREARTLARYARGYAATQARTIDAVTPLAPRCVLVPAVRGLDEHRRLDALADLGETLRAALEER